MGTIHVNDRVRKHRQGLREAGYRQVNVWVPDMRRAELLETCARQVAKVNASDREDKQLVELMDMALDDLARGGEWR
jgi:hypothetical protein